MREVAKLPMMELDCNISFTITTTQTNKDKKNGYIHLQVPKQGLRHGGAAGTFQRHTKCVSAFAAFCWTTASFKRLPLLCPRPLRLRIFGNCIICAGVWKLLSATSNIRWGWSISTGGLMLQELYADLTAFNFASRVCC